MQGKNQHRQRTSTDNRIHQKRGRGWTGEIAYTEGVQGAPKQNEASKQGSSNLQPPTKEAIRKKPK
jgi:hypothetical protein